MPFTPSHAVVALPFIRTPLVPAAIAVGAMTPDISLFVRAGIPDYGITHNLAYLPVTTGMALVLMLVWRLVLRPAVRPLLPRFVAERLPASWEQSAGSTLRETFIGSRRVPLEALVLLASLALGVVTHVLWDSFTHEGRQDYAWLEATWGALPAYKWLQHGSSTLGLLILAVWGWRYLRRQPRRSVSHPAPGWLRWAWILSLPLALAIAWGIGLSSFGPLDGDFTVAHLAYRVLPPACAVWGAATLLLCLGLASRAPKVETVP